MTGSSDVHYSSIDTGATTPTFRRELFTKIRSAIQRNALVTGGTDPNHCALVDNLGAGGAKVGIVGSHAYSIIGATTVSGCMLLHCRNPWGATEWGGDWRDDDPRWTRRAIQELNDDPLNGGNYVNASDGSFFISVNDFCDRFDGMTSCIVTSDEMPYFTLIEGAWESGNCGGVSSCNNPQYYISAPLGCEIAIHMSVPQDALETGAIRMSLCRPSSYDIEKAWLSGRIETHVDSPRQSKYMNYRSVELPEEGHLLTTDDADVYPTQASNVSNLFFRSFSSVLFVCVVFYFLRNLIYLWTFLYLLCLCFSSLLLFFFSFTHMPLMSTFLCFDVPKGRIRTYPDDGWSSDGAWLSGDKYCCV